MDQPRVSIVTPSYNQGPFIRATIESILSQDYPNLEYIIMDGGSTDETAAVASEYSGRLTFISEPDRGQSHAINKGFHLATGDILAWVNSDDILLPHAVRRAVEGLAQNPLAGAVYGEGYLMDRAGHITCRFPHTQRFNLWRLIHFSDYVLQQSLFFRRQALEEAGLVREDLHYTMDWDLLIRIGQRRPLHYIPAYLGALREYPEAKSFAGGHRRVREIRDMLREHTGRGLSPGYIAYAMETYRHAWSHVLCSALPDSVPRAREAVQTLVHYACMFLAGSCVQFLTRNMPKGGLAGATVPLLLPPGRSTLVVEGRIPTLWLRGQVLHCSAAGRGFPPIQLGLGPFRIELPIESEVPFEVVIQAEKTVVPAFTFEHSLKRRPAAYVLDRVVWLGEELGW